MEKLILLLIINSPDHTAISQRFVANDCFAIAAKINSNPNNYVVYQDELDDVRRNVALCEMADGTRIVIPTLLRK